MVENSYHWRSTIHEFWDVLWPLKQISQPPWWNTTISSHAANAAGGDPTQFSYDLTGTTGCPVVNPGRWWFRIKECRNAPNLQGLEAVILPRSFGVVKKSTWDDVCEILRNLLCQPWSCGGVNSDGTGMFHGNNICYRWFGARCIRHFKLASFFLPRFVGIYGFLRVRHLWWCFGSTYKHQPTKWWFFPYDFHLSTGRLAAGLITFVSWNYIFAIPKKNEFGNGSFLLKTTGLLMFLLPTNSLSVGNWRSFAGLCVSSLSQYSADVSW